MSSKTFDEFCFISDRLAVKKKLITLLQESENNYSSNQTREGRYIDQGIVDGIRSWVKEKTVN